MKFVILILLVATFAVWAAIKLISGKFRDPDLEGRFIERLSYIPSRVPTSALLTRDVFESWLNDQAKTGVRQTYAFPVLFPLDYLFLTSLGLFLGLGSVAISGKLVFLRTIPVWIWWIFPFQLSTSSATRSKIRFSLPFFPQN